MAAAKERVNAYGWENTARSFFGDLRFAGRQLREAQGIHCDGGANASFGHRGKRRHLYRD